MKDTFAFLSTMFIVYLYFLIVGIWFLFYVTYSIIKNGLIGIFNFIKKPFLINNKFK